jgi:hypothetical protein
MTESIPREHGMNKHRAIVAVLVTLFLLSPAIAHAEGFHEADAVVVNLKLCDLSRVAREALRTDLGEGIEGRREEVSDSVHDLTYRAEFTEPVISLDPDGRIRLTLGIREADVRIGRLEKKVLGRRMSCEGAGLSIYPDDPVGISVAVRVGVEDGALSVIPDEVLVSNARRGIKLVKPERCRKNPIPEWLMWAIGKPFLRRQISHLDEIVLEKAQDSAARLREDEDLVHRSWKAESGTVSLAPSAIDTGHGTLILALAGSSVPHDPAASVSANAGDGPVEAVWARSGTPMNDPQEATSRRWAEEFQKGTFVALSEPFVNAVVQAAAPVGSKRIDLDGKLRKIFRSDEIFTMIPGLRGVESREDLYLTIEFDSPPRFSLGTPEMADLPDGVDANLGLLTLGFDFRGLQLSLWQTNDDGGEDLWLGTTRVDIGRLEMLPYTGPIGGVSFELLENEWKVSSVGIESNDTLVAATIQELIFGEVFETTYDPPLRNQLKVGRAVFVPREFARVGHHLVIGLDLPEIEPAAAPDDSLVATSSVDR